MTFAKIVFLSIFSLSAAQCFSQVQVDKSLGDRIGKAVEKAARFTGAIKTYGQPRIIEKGAQPEISIKAGSVYFNGHRLSFGALRQSWTSVIGEGAVCSEKTGVLVWCKWDKLGLEIKGSLESPDKITNFTINLNRDKEEGLYDYRPLGADGKPIEAKWLATGVYSGYLSFSGYGVDHLTKFWELRESIPAEYHLECGLMDCANPRGFHPPELKIYVRLNGRSENDELMLLTFSSE